MIRILADFTVIAAFLFAGFVWLAIYATGGV